LDALAQLNAHTMDLFDELRADGVTYEMHEDGLLFAGLTMAAVHDAAQGLQFLERFGYPRIDILNGHALRAIEPALSDNVAGGFHISNERHVRPETLTAGLCAWLIEHCVEVRTGLTVWSVRRNGQSGLTVETDAGAFNADQVLIAAGAWSGELLKASGVHLPVEAGKGYSVTWDAPTSQLRGPVDLIEAHVACTPFAGALRLAGTMELSGLNERLVPARVEAVRRAGRQYFRQPLDGAFEQVWVGVRPLLPDGLPAIGAVRGFENLFVATGHGMLGVTLAPATAVAIAGMMTRQESSASLVSFDPNRFSRHLRFHRR